MADTTYEAQKLYVAYFGRPADVAGLDYWKGALSSNPIATQDMSRSFSQSQEYRDKYAGMDNRAIVGEVYENLFGRPAEAAGVDYWAGLLNNNAITIDNVVTQIAGGARGNDSLVFNGKIAAASLFTTRLDLPTERAAYAADGALEIAMQYIDTIKNITSAASAMDPGVVDSWIDRIVAANGTGVELVGVQAEPEPLPGF